jgi:hypothetical protein
MPTGVHLLAVFLVTTLCLTFADEGTHFACLNRFCLLEWVILLGGDDMTMMIKDKFLFAQRFQPYNIDS